MKNKELKKIRKKKEQISIETIEICSETGEIQGWCVVMRDLGLFKCEKDCKTCLCG